MESKSGICIRRMDYDIRFEEVPAGDIAGTPLEGASLVAVKGTITEKRQCYDEVPFGITFGNTAYNNTIEVTYDGRRVNTVFEPFCGDPDSLGDDGADLTKGIWQGLLPHLTQDCRRRYPSGNQLSKYRIKYSCYFDEGPCPAANEYETVGQGDDMFVGRACTYEGPAESLMQGLFGNSDIQWTPGSDVPFGHVPADYCDYLDWNPDCDLFQFIADKIAEKKLSNAIGNIVINAIGTLATGGSFGLLDLISAIRTIRSGGTILGKAADVLEEAITEAYEEYYKCLADSLEV